MAGYIILWVALLICSTRADNKKLVWFFIILLSLVAGLRGVDVGTDTKTYADIYGWIAEGQAKYIEPGWWLLNRLVSWTGGGFQLLLWLVALLTLVPVGWVIQRDSPNPMLSLFFYFSLFIFLNSLNLARQIMAISYVLVGYSMYARGRRWWFVVWTLVASTFHASALIVLPIFFVDWIKLRPGVVAILAVLSLVAGTVAIGPLMSVAAGDYASYLENSPFGYRKTSLTSALALSLMLNVLMAVIYATSRRELRNNFWIKVFVAGIIVNNLTFRLLLGSRVIIFFNVAQIIFFVLYIINDRFKQRWAAPAIVIGYSSAIFFKLLLAGTGEVYPYTFFFQ